MTFKRALSLAYRLHPAPIILVLSIMFARHLVEALETFGLDYPWVRWPFFIAIACMVLSIIKALITAPDPYNLFTSWRPGDVAEDAREEPTPDLRS